MAVIYAFADSITYGAWDIEGSGWTARLRQYLDELQEKNPEYYGLFYNLGIPGETTGGLVKRFENETNAREREGEEAIFIFAYGANDAAFLSVKNQFRVSKKDFRRNLEQVIERARSISDKILLVNILPVVESKNSSPRNGKVRLNKYMDEYNAVLSDISAKLRIEMIDVHSIFMKEGHEKLFVLDDGLHPNSKGYKIIFEAIYPVLQKMLGWK